MKVNAIPKINRKSQQIIEKKTDALYQTRMSKDNARSNSRTGVSGTRKKSEGKYEGYLDGKSQKFKQKQEELAKKYEADKISECTFSPKINQN